jgi:hypothetical protein
VEEKVKRRGKDGSEKKNVKRRLNDKGKTIGKRREEGT